MTQPTYDFHTQLATGEEGEARLDEYFARWYTIDPATMAVLYWGPVW